MIVAPVRTNERQVTFTRIQHLPFTYTGHRPDLDYTVEATFDEIEDFEMVGNPPIDSDVIADELMTALLGHLEAEKLLEDAESAPTSS